MANVVASGLSLSFGLEIEAARQAFREMDRWAVNYITAAALTDVAVAGRKAEQKAMPFYLDRPTAYTQRGVRYRKAEARWLEAEIYLNDEPGKGTAQVKYLAPNVKGGPRGAKRFEVALRRAGIMMPNEFAVPASGQTDANGNLRGGGSRIVRILSQIKAAETTAGYMANETRRSRQRNAKRNVERYFVADGSTRLRRGIWERRGKRIRPILIFVGQPMYQATYKFGEATMQYARLNFARHWARRFDAMVASGRIYRGGAPTRGLLAA